MIYKSTIKRMLDIILAIIGILLMLPVALLIIIWIKLDSKGPVLFKQRRIGKGKSEFYILKFRTMRTDTPPDMPTHLLHNPDEYITRAGRILRRVSFDELPQILNILKGEMSIIGPRPALWNQQDLIEERDLYGANEVTPGLTGWAQINGRDELPIDVKAKLDGEYVEKLSFVFDVKVFFITIAHMVTGKGIKEGNSQSRLL